MEVCKLVYNLLKGLITYIGAITQLLSTMDNLPFPNKGGPKNQFAPITPFTVSHLFSTIFRHAHVVRRLQTDTRHLLLNIGTPSGSPQ